MLRLLARKNLLEHKLNIFTIINMFDIISFLGFIPHRTAVLKQAWAKPKILVTI